MADVRVDSFAGLPILYDRQVAGHYGVTGIKIRPFVNRKFAEETEAFFQHLVSAMNSAGFGPIDSILTGGISRAGIGPSLHHKNRAFDLDGLVLPRGNWVADTFPDRPVLYLAIESVLRQHFGTVLAYTYNKDHEDHFHFDNGTALGFKRHAKSHVMFLQYCLTLIFGIKVGLDGVWGPETSGATKLVLGELGIGSIETKKNWALLLADIERRAFSLAE